MKSPRAGENQESLGFERAVSSILQTASSRSTSLITGGYFAVYHEEFACVHRVVHSADDSVTRVNCQLCFGYNLLLGPQAQTVGVERLGKNHATDGQISERYTWGVVQVILSYRPERLRSDAEKALGIVRTELFKRGGQDFVDRWKK